MHEIGESACRIQILLDFLCGGKKKVSTEIEALMIIRKDKLGTFSGQIIMFFIITKKAMGDAFKTFSFTSNTSVHRDLENKDIFKILILFPFASASKEFLPLFLSKVYLLHL